MREGAGQIRNTAKVWSYRWESYEHQELYNMVKGDVKGVSALETATTSWATLTDSVTQTRGAVERLLAASGAEWQGGSAESMAAGVSPLAAWADEAAAAGERSQASLRQVSEAFSYAANSMPEPVPVPSKATNGLPTTFGGVVAGQTDEDAAERQSQQVHARAVDLMSGYNLQNQSSTGSAGTFLEPRQMGVTADTAGSSGRIDGGGSDGGPSGDQDRRGSGGPGGSGPGGGPLPGSGSEPSGPGSTGAAQANVPPPAPTLPAGQPPTSWTPPPVSSTPPLATHPFTPITGVLNEPGRGGGAGGGRMPGGSGGGAGGRVGGGGVPGTGGTPGRGGVVGTGPLAGENAAARSGPIAGARGGAPGAMGPMGGAGAGQKDEDKERKTAEYLRDYNDEFWDDTPPVAPAVIGEDDDD